ncbi:Shedu anti-phage system protein SduA domain-containing protein [Vibrio coralliilyticus]|uniref:Shedu anti-phage system protein SduA domain-containing protein n=1 Tax=Vibrio coralliilyticus TaxID=190893 RepID=UPI0039175976
MQIFIPCSFDISQATDGLDKLDTLLSQKPEIGESELQNIFEENESLIFLMGLEFDLVKPAIYNAETSIFRKYRTDFVIASENGEQMSLVEFEEAKLESIFTMNENKRSVRYDWSNTFEHGVSQISDWFYMLSRKNGTKDMEDEFGWQESKYKGFVVVGRDAGIGCSERRNRLGWRIANTVINSKHIDFYTFDSLYRALVNQLEVMKTCAALLGKDG